MKNSLSFDVLSCVNQVYGRMQDNYKFAYPGDNFESSRAHQILCRFGTFSSFIHTLLQSENFDTDNAVDSIYFQQVLANSKIIAFDKDWSYPSGNLSTNRASTSLNCIESSIRNYESSVKILDIPIGTLVEITYKSDYEEENESKYGLRLFVVNHSRDCDGTPLYDMSFDQKAFKEFQETETKIKNRDFENSMDDALIRWMHQRSGGAILRHYGRESLKVVKPCE